MLNGIITRRRIVEDMLIRANGRFVSVTFVKKDGTLRRLNIQPEAVATHTTGCKTEAAKRAVHSRRKNNPHLLPVYDVQAGQIKSINLHTIREACADGVRVRFNVEGEAA
jgi:hypothetical protein